MPFPIENLTKLVVECGSHNIIHIDKLFGPAVISELRMFLDDNCHWVIQQDQQNDAEKLEPKWVTVAQFDGDPFPVNDDDL